MKRYLLAGVVFPFFLSLAACTNQNPYLSTDHTQENWRQLVDTNPHRWTKGADSWFLTGNPNMAELINRRAPYGAAISTMKVTVPDNYTDIKIDGAFQVQIFGTDEHNTLYLYGPNEGVREVAVEIQGKTLYIRQTQYISPKVMERVIVRIGVRRLRNLTQMGCGTIEAIRIRSSNLCIAATNTACGNVYLAGNVNLRRVDNAGNAAISVFGAYTPALEIKTSGTGSVNISGSVGVRSIEHQGAGDINIIGANSNGLNIRAEGKGKIGIQGFVNLKEVEAKDDACVYAYLVNSDNIKVSAYQHARVGLAGCARTLSAYTFNASRFYGRDFCTQSAFVRAHDTSHMNVTASQKLFASAAGDSSIYFFGPSNLVSEYVNGDGRIISMGNSHWCNYYSEYRPYSYTLSHPYLYKMEGISSRPRTPWKPKRSARAMSYIK
ncbi:GIN domain-containing protein [Aquicella lusitana]|uniref:Putative autotransporter adhesin-like protein n=1 Tax=Aquicella lusitana TaxID=254246 RepID=A0A370GH08_9COXI|nr:DUF2807 domain-containing protein [Aquicella lusitana]RDI42439.1 putative autotransporter adhesin-like protein [Aquicella lusitana]VVC74099.1 hypothetical protein AQULUS_18640 [Aquicella lusitana]